MDFHREIVKRNRMHHLGGHNIYLPPSPVVPRTLIITSITNTNPLLVTVSQKNVYVPGQLIYFSIPFDYGMFQLNGLTGRIMDVNAANLVFLVDINAAQFDPFINPPNGVAQPATVSPAGSRNLHNLNTNLKKEPFHSLENFGN